MQISIILAATLGLASAQVLSPACTTTLLPTGVACCPPVAGVTATSYVDCNNCALEIAPSASCRRVCETPAPTSLGSTTTITACGASATPTFQTLPVEPTTCASTITKWGNPCGDCGHVYATTNTASVDCGGCGGLVTVTSTASDAGGICACPTGDVATKEVCAPSVTLA